MSIVAINLKTLIMIDNYVNDDMRVFYSHIHSLWVILISLV